MIATHPAPPISASPPCAPNLAQELKSLLTAKLVTDENYVNEVQRVLEKHQI